MKKEDQIIKAIVKMIYNEEVGIDTPSETMEQIKTKLHAEGLYSYSYRK